VWVDIGPSLTAVVDPVVAAKEKKERADTVAAENCSAGAGAYNATDVSGGSDGGLDDEPVDAAVAQYLWLRFIAEQQRELLRDRLRPMPEPLTVHDAARPGHGSDDADANGAAAVAAAHALRRDGVVFLRGVVPDRLCDALRAEVDACAERAREKVGGDGLRRIDLLLDQVLHLADLARDIAENRDIAGQGRCHIDRTLHRPGNSAKQCSCA
jgi:hypothetical protein